MDYTEKTLTCEEKYRGKIIYVHRDTVTLPDGSEAVREVVEHSGGVGVIPVAEDGTVWCVRQFRYPMGAHLLEIPAGKLEPGEDPKVCAVRELGEETGFTAGRLVDLGVTYASPGISDETLHLYLALDLVPGRQHLDVDEFLGVEKWPLEELYAMVLRGEIHDGKTEIAVMKAREILRNGG